MKLEEILKLAAEKKASDIHLKVGIVPVIRKHGKLRPIAEGLTPMTAKDLDEYAKQFLNEQELAYLEKNREIDIGYGMKDVGRFRVNIFFQRGSVRIVIRIISDHVPEIEQLKLPNIVESFAELERGLVLVTGVTGSGKSTTLAAIINRINQNKNRHIVTIEDPIEYLIRDKKSIVSQREIGLDTRSFAHALRASLRQDPDVILIGEMRDKETIETALLAAETGHLVFSTVHTYDAQETINRILAVFEGRTQDQIRRQLAGVLKAVVSQRLARRKDNKGFAPAVEVLVCNQRVKEMIEDPEKTSQISSVLESSAKSTGMQSFDQSLIQLIAQDIIDIDEAMRLTNNPDDFTLKLSGIQNNAESKWTENVEVKKHILKNTQGLPNLSLDKNYHED